MVHADVQPQIRSPMLLLLLVMGLAFALRLHQLGAQNFWFDEVETIRFASNMAAYSDNHPPLHYLFVSWWLQLGDSEFFLRFISTVEGLIVVALVYRVGKALIGDQNALLAMLLASVSPLLVWQAQDVRMYTQLVMFSLPTIYTYRRLLTGGRPIWWAGYLVTALLALFTHLFAGLLILALSFHLLVFHRRWLWRWLTVNITILLLYLPTLLFITANLRAQIGTYRPASPLYILFTYYTFVVGHDLGPTLAELRLFDFQVLISHAPVLILTGTLASALGIPGLIALWRGDKDRTVLIVSVAVLPVVTAITLSALFPRLSYNVRYVIPALPAFLWIIASGLGALKGPVRAVLLLIILTFSGLALRNHYYTTAYAKEDVRAAVQYLEKNADPEEPIVVTSVGNVFRWYYGGTNPVFDFRRSQPLGELTQQLDHKSFWLVQSRLWQSDPEQTAEKYFDSNYTPVDVQSFHGVKITEYCLSECNAADLERD